MKLFALIFVGWFTLSLGQRCRPEDEKIHGYNQGGNKPSSSLEVPLCDPRLSPNPRPLPRRYKPKLISSNRNRNGTREKLEKLTSSNVDPSEIRKALLNLFVSTERVRRYAHPVPPNVYQQLVNKTGTPPPFILPGLPPPSGPFGRQVKLNSEKTDGLNPRERRYAHALSPHVLKLIMNIPYTPPPASPPPTSLFEGQAKLDLETTRSLSTEVPPLPSSSVLEKGHDDV